jgi:hypothetical protein
MLKNDAPTCGGSIVGLTFQRRHNRYGICQMLFKKKIEIILKKSKFRSQVIDFVCLKNLFFLEALGFEINILLMLRKIG